MFHADPVRVVESAYALHREDTTWLSGIVDAAGSLNPGSGVYAFTYDLRETDKVSIKVMVTSASMPGWERGVESLVPLGPGLFHALFGPSPTVALASKGLGFAPPAVRAGVTRIWNEAGIRDHIGIKGVDPSGQSVLLGLALPMKRVSASPRRLDTLSRLSAHLVSGLRLRRALQGMHALPDDTTTEAVLDPRGKVLHARAPAKAEDSRTALSRACRAIDTARGSLRSSEPDRAVAIWHGLVQGRWTLLDHHDTDGKRFVLARKNDPVMRDPKALSLRERQVLAFAALGHSNKMIAYELGLTASTIAGHLHSVLAKMRIGSRRELIQMFGWEAPPP